MGEGFGLMVRHPSGERGQGWELEARSGKERVSEWNGGIPKASYKSSLKCRWLGLAPVDLSSLVDTARPIRNVRIACGAAVE